MSASPSKSLSRPGPSVRPTTCALCATSTRPPSRSSPSSQTRSRRGSHRAPTAPTRRCKSRRRAARR
eukprot:3533027-Prymnesium_polylepis.1